MFEHCALIAQEDVSYMPYLPFKFYVQVYMDYLESEDSKGDADAASCFFSLIKFRRSDLKRSGNGHMEQVTRLLKKIRGRQDWFDADEDIYGNFPSRVDEAIEDIGLV